MSCAHGPAFDHNTIKDDVYIDPSNSWMNNSPNSHVPSLRAVTLRIVNKKYRSVDVRIQCTFIDDGRLFGKIVKTINARDDAIVMVRGFARSSFDEEVRCIIKSIR
jgi:hypothetical protein